MSSSPILFLPCSLQRLVDPTFHGVRENSRKLQILMHDPVGGHVILNSLTSQNLPIKTPFSQLPGPHKAVESMNK